MWHKSGKHWVILIMAAHLAIMQWGRVPAIATLQIIQKENLVENAANMGAFLGDQLKMALSDHPYVGDIRGKGLFWGIELVQDKETKQPFPAERHLAWHIWQRAFDLGLIVYYSQGCADGINGDLIMVGPPLIITQTQIEELVGILRLAFDGL